MRGQPLDRVHEALPPSTPAKPPQRRLPRGLAFPEGVLPPRPHLLTQSALWLSFHLQHGDSEVGLERGVFPCLTKLDQDRGTFFSNFFLRFGGFTVSVASSWVLFRGDSHYPSCVAFPKTSRPPCCVTCFKESHWTAAYSCHKTGYLISTTSVAAV